MHKKKYRTLLTLFLILDFILAATLPFEKRYLPFTLSLLFGLPITL
ncbi:hypothetical protein PAECIP111892_02369 [Paenibacillus auburnensis]|uniref:Rod shape-determining protein MreD n=1 Tax=Paenibacillus auburnensis TaxID=2905649 RepID=A0ABM9BX68_9BACL|nr:hypothetical protein PAECIP111892_02369 [Paenibacillus auburnensis]